MRSALPDPPVLTDGLCARAGCGKPRRPERSQRYARALAELDPFCSMECRRRFHGLPVPRELLEERVALKRARAAA